MIELGDTLKQFDNATLDYDLERFNWPEWALGIIQEVEPGITELETFHENLTPPQIVRIQQHVQMACSRKDFMERFDAFAAAYIPQRIQNKRYMIQRQGTLRVVIPNQAKAGRRLQFHQGIWVGNGRGLRTIWTPFTEARGTNTMQILPLKESRELTQRVYDQQLSLDEFERQALEDCFPVTLKPGQSHLFFQEHIHGNVNNTEGYTRVSMDMRILVEGEEYLRKLPGGYFRFPGDYEAGSEQDHTGRKFITYAGWNSSFSDGIPLPMQRAIIDQYCNKNKISYSDYNFENEHLNWFPSLRQFIKEKHDGIVLCSMFCLPDKKEWRDEILELALECGVELHFANELTSLRTREDLARIADTIEFAVSKAT